MIIRPKYKKGGGYVHVNCVARAHALCAEYMYGIKRIRNLVANTMAFWFSLQHGCELNLRAHHRGAFLSIRGEAVLTKGWAFFIICRLW